MPQPWEMLGSRLRGSLIISSKTYKTIYNFSNKIECHKTIANSARLEELVLHLREAVEGRIREELRAIKIS